MELPPRRFAQHVAHLTFGDLAPALTQGLIERQGLADPVLILGMMGHLARVAEFGVEEKRLVSALDSKVVQPRHLIAHFYHPVALHHHFDVGDVLAASDEVKGKGLDSRSGLAGAKPATV